MAVKGILHVARFVQISLHEDLVDCCEWRAKLCKNPTKLDLCTLSCGGYFHHLVCVHPSVRMNVTAVGVFLVSGAYLCYWLWLDLTITDLTTLQGQMDALEAEYGRVQEDYDNAAKRFGEDPTKVPSGDFFALVSVRVFFFFFHLWVIRFFSVPFFFLLLAPPIAACLRTYHARACPPLPLEMWERCQDRREEFAWGFRLCRRVPAYDRCLASDPRVRAAVCLPPSLLFSCARDVIGFSVSVCTGLSSVLGEPGVILRPRVSAACLRFYF